MCKFLCFRKKKKLPKLTLLEWWGLPTNTNADRGWGVINEQKSAYVVCLWSVNYTHINTIGKNIWIGIMRNEEKWAPFQRKLAKRITRQQTRQTIRNILHTKLLTRTECEDKLIKNKKKELMMGQWSWGNHCSWPNPLGNAKKHKTVAEFTLTR